MKHITILVPNGDNNLSSIVGAYKILSRANRYWMELGNKNCYKIELAGSSKKIEFHDGLFSAQPHQRFTNIQSTQLIIIPSLQHNYEKAVHMNQDLIHWIGEQHAKGAEIASICTGAFLLAATGLLTNRHCSTHWAFAATLQNLYPAIKVQPDQLITDENGLYTNGGAYSFLNLLLYLVEKYFDRPTAIYCSKVFQIEMDRTRQSEFILFNGLKTHTDETILQVQAFMETNLRTTLSIEQLATSFSIGRRSLDRRFSKATGHTPLEYLQRLKIEAAKKAFETSRQTIAEVMYDLGYTDIKSFRELFKKITGLSPMEYRKKYNKTALVIS
ncbi:helix-turn-helix domain-containing protein [Flavihumibacter sp. CACIAM 22H1]|uniref:GlxA family transcriptional regulator n=1 Tax=Flavihumibacter sp. CACIAM 22H1 TaxID=1812911 RepID=UPI0007A7D868|nr:helix-turn-helix domain-containing protein [Flavihumibacter sp. CACIAM 22H1]KYP14203.1 MAG: AraC family transcriptional regulator [Flavihumibacter sp. CACIAM 22H1]